MNTATKTTGNGCIVTYPSMRVALERNDPFQTAELSELAYVQEEISDRDRVMQEREYEDRARWGHD